MICLDLFPKNMEGETCIEAGIKYEEPWVDRLIVEAGGWYIEFITWFCPLVQTLAASTVKVRKNTLD